MKQEEKTNIYYDEDGDLSLLDNRTIAVIGYGNQGRSQALNLRDSGVEDVIVGNIKDESWEQAEEDGFDVYTISEAASKADVLFILIPDEIAPKVYESEIKPNLEEGNVLNFASGYNITYDFIEPPEFVDVVMVAPRMVGKMVRDLYEEGDGAPSFLAVEQDYSGEAKDIAIALAKGIGSTKAGVIEVTFDMETKSDLLSEQGLIPLIFNAFIAKYQIEVEEGLPPEAALLELYLSREMAQTLDEMAKMGILGQLPLHSRTSQYGQLSRTDDLVEGRAEDLNLSEMKEYMKKQLDKIDNGNFAREWTTEQETGYPSLKRLYKKYWNSDFIKDEQKTMEKLGLKEEKE